MRLGIYCDSGINGGHEEMLKRLMLALASSKHLDTLHILVPNSNALLYGYVTELARDNEKVRAVALPFTSESLKDNRLTLLPAIRSTAATLRTLKITKLIVAQGTIVSGLAGLFAGRYARVPTVSYLPLVDDPPLRAGMTGKAKWMAKRVLYRMPNEFITLNEHLQGKLQRLAPHVRSMILENCVDDRFSRTGLTKSAARATLGLPDDGTTIIAQIGRINFDQKRQDFLMRVIESNPDAFENALVLVVGEGPDASRLAAMVNASPILSSRVRLVGPRSDVLPYIVASDTLVLPSAFEGVPLVMIEAVLAERPIVVSRVSGLDAYMPDALLFPPDDANAFIQRILAAPNFSMSVLASDFRRRFSREVFDAQAQKIVTAAPTQSDALDLTSTLT
ncbi:glycosyltransferase [Caballeronia sp. LZ062]|uniref:glycosyltransferase n=1 Tax=unclassified Caballeronia TaxID=2646786 RepID=UPI0028643DD2|nr:MULTISPECIES: glycosyltransferase [unclassified Caballeronia]MDR5857702.1 glycosyltransferase [Caballeronia sp. LZ050]MDR5869252.1 glycosyltransferase [Caballeronia sp. LZ062]